MLQSIAQLLTGKTAQERESEHWLRQEVAYLNRQIEEQAQHLYQFLGENGGRYWHDENGALHLDANAHALITCIEQGCDVWYGLQYTHGVLYGVCNVDVTASEVTQGFAGGWYQGLQRRAELGFDDLIVSIEQVNQRQEVFWEQQFTGGDE